MAVASLIPKPRTVSPGGWALGAAVVLGVFALVGGLAPERAASRAVVAVAAAGLLGALAVRSPRDAVRALVLWLAVLGLSRRLASEVLADPSKDPLLLVAPFGAGVLCARALLDGAARAAGAVAYGVAALTVVVLAQVVNPRQGGLTVGLAGLLVWLVPMLFYWIGRRYLDDRSARRLIDVVGFVCAVAGFYGLLQFGVGFPPWDDHWIRDRGYAALFIGPTTVRPFGLSASASEFAIVSAFGSLWAALVAVRALRRRSLVIATAAAIVSGASGVALVLTSVRITLALGALAAVVVLIVGVRRRPWLPFLLVLLLAGAGVAVAQGIDVDSLPRDGSAAAARRVVAFLQDPTGDRYEVTTDEHWELLRSGVEEGFRRPFGLGTGSTNRGAEQFGQAGQDRESDLPNAGVAFGIPGLALVTWCTLAVLVLTVRRARRERDLLHLAILGLLVISLGKWWNGAHYFASAVLWLFIGFVDRVPLLRTARTRADRRASGDREPARA